MPTTLETAPFHVDPLSGSDSNNGRTPDAPLRTFARLASRGAWSPGVSILLRRGRNYAEPLEAAGSGTAEQPITVSNYGEGDLPILDPIGEGKSGFNFRQFGGLIVDGLDCRSRTNANGITSVLYGGPLASTIRNCRVTNPMGNGIEVYCPAGSGAGDFGGWVVENNVAYDCGYHGITMGPGMSRYRVSGNTVSGCGRRIGAHGISLIQAQYQGALAWLPVTRSIFRAQIDGPTHTPWLSTTPWIESVYFTIGGANWALRENPWAEPTSLARGEYLFTDGYLYVNLGGMDPGAATFRYLGYGGTRGWIVSDNKVTDQRNPNNDEGACIQADFFVGFGTITRNFCSNGSGAALIVANSSQNTVISANVVVNTNGGKLGGQGILMGYANNNATIVHNTVVVNGLRQNYSGISVTGSHAGGKRRYLNNLVVGTCAHGIFDVDGAAQELEVAGNCVFGPGAKGYRGQGSNLDAALESRILSIDPKLDANFRPGTAQLDIGVYAGTMFDRYQRPFRNPPTIGAVQR